MAFMNEIVGTRAIGEFYDTVYFTCKFQNGQLILRATIYTKARERPLRESIE
jgi:hypothetical protein